MNDFTDKIDVVVKAFEPVREFFVENGPETAYRNELGEKRYVGEELPEGWTHCMLRLDWELAYDGTQEDLDRIMHNDRATTIDLMIAAGANDLADLIVNGDWDNYNDALYKSMNGEVKRGKKVEEVSIFSAQYFQQVVPKKNSVEYTLYIVLGTRW